MAQKATTQTEATFDDQLAAFKAVDGIVAANPTNYDGRKRVLIKVMDEDAVGEFMRLRRTLGANMSSVTRKDLDDTVLDGWLNSE